MKTDALTPERRLQIDSLFDQALDVPVENRQKWLKSRCGSDCELIREVESLLQFAAEDFPLACATEPLESFEVTDLSGTRIGAYILHKPVGRGGMASVYEAERSDGQFKQRVAIKIAHTALALSNDGLHRFQREKRILAGLIHPHIARILDGGSHVDGCAYIAMEFIEGHDIVTHCAKHQLSLSNRLALMIDACKAVHFAHQNLIIHRDLKPSNIMVDIHGQVKLLDFGIAKMLDPDHAIDRSLTLGHVLTPRYASPEQVHGKHVTTASDVYQLGLLLFELINEHPAQTFPSGDFAAMERVICHQAPPSLRSKTGARIHKDLEHIVLMCLRKEPDRRYQSPQSLADDLQRFLSKQPVAASGDAFSYRVSRFLERHRFGASVISLLVLMLAGYMYTLAINQRRIETERDRAQIQAKRATDIKDYVKHLLWDLTNSAETTQERKQVLSLLQRNEALMDQDQNLDMAMKAEVYRILGDIYRNQGWYEASLNSFHKAAPLFERGLGPYHPDTIENQRHIARTLHFIGDYHAAEPVLVDVLEKRIDMFGYKNVAVANSMNNLGSLLYAMGRYDDAAPLLHSALNLRRELQVFDSELANNLLNLGDLYMGKREWEKAISYYRQSTNVAVTLYHPGHWQASLSEEALAYVYLMQQKPDDAASILNECLTTRLAAFGDWHPLIAETLKNMALLQSQRHNFEDALESVQCALTMYESRLSNIHPFVARTYVQMSVLLLEMGQQEKAESARQEGLKRLQANGLANHPFGRQ